jgi:hypothetical protein
MVRARHGLPLVPVVFGMSLALAACGGTISGTGGSGPAAANAAASVAAGSGSGGSPVCSAVERDYPLLLANKLPMAPTGGNQWDAFGYALGQLLPSGEMPTGVGSDVFNLENDAVTISDDISQSGAGPQDYQQFDTDLQTVAKDCGTTFQPLPKSLTG